jgi:hypothetical protein
MTQNEAHVWNNAINAAIMQYRHGIGAIHRLKIPYSITVEHIGATTTQDIVYDTDARNPNASCEE